MQRALFILAAAAIALPAVASAQPAISGPMTIERMHSGPLAAADAKVTEIDHRTSEVIGGQAGWVVDDTVFIGGARYWLANGSRNRRMAYGGFVVQWLARSDERFGYGLKGLVDSAARSASSGQQRSDSAGTSFSPNPKRTHSSGSIDTSA
jgi:hypothetical protein